jgi:hypothetical protein
MKTLWLACFACGLLGLGGCSPACPSNATGPNNRRLIWPAISAATIDGWGMFQDRSGAVIKRFHVVIDAHWEVRDGVDVGTLDENFSWSDGSTSRRVWTITRVDASRYVGRADDVVGEAHGEAAGNALRWRYVLALPVDGRVWNVDFDDWMFLIDDRVMLNRSEMRKFGFHLGQVTLSFTRAVTR